jgi:Xaa-Pro aminopeptidase
MTIDSNLYAKRRAQLAAKMAAQAPNSIAIIPTAPERQRNRDSDFLYRHDSYFYYLTGFTEPNAWLVLTSDGHATLFCQPKDLEREIWDGVRLGPEAAPSQLGVHTAWSVSALDLIFARLLLDLISRLHC